MSLYNEISRRYEAQLHIISVLFKLSRVAINSQQMIKHFPSPCGNIKLMMKQSCCIFANTYQTRQVRLGFTGVSSQRGFECRPISRYFLTAPDTAKKSSTL